MGLDCKEEVGGIMGLFDKDKKKDQEKFGLFSFMNDDNDELNDLQKEEMKKGNYDSWDFEEDDVDDDSYYSEDDE